MLYTPNCPPLVQIWNELEINRASLVRGWHDEFSEFVVYSTDFHHLSTTALTREYVDLWELGDDPNKINPFLLGVSNHDISRAFLPQVEYEQPWRVSVSDELLNHPEKGTTILRDLLLICSSQVVDRLNLPYFPPELQLAYQVPLLHHVLPNSRRGYPSYYRGERLNYRKLPSRIVQFSIIDRFDALIANTVSAALSGGEDLKFRLYSNAKSPDLALNIIIDELNGIGFFEDGNINQRTKIDALTLLDRLRTDFVVHNTGFNLRNYIRVVGNTLEAFPFDRFIDNPLIAGLLPQSHANAYKKREASPNFVIDI